MISGFVICGLVIEKREKYGAYLLRRAARIFPAYLAAFAIAWLLMPMAATAIGSSPWADPGEASFGMRADPISWQNVWTYLFLLQGISQDAVRSTAVLPPAWSLSLEWQFYLFAPALVLAIANLRWSVWALATCIVVGMANALDIFGRYEMPSFLPCALWIFAIGILLRLHWTRAASVLHPLAPLLQPLASPLARYLGERSYSVYVFHWPALYVSFIALDTLSLAGSGAIAFVWTSTVALVLIASHVSYALLERPTMQLAARYMAIAPGAQESSRSPSVLPGDPRGLKTFGDDR